MKKKEISHASQILTNDRQILVLSQLSNYYGNKLFNFSTFVITGPTTTSTSVVALLAGAPNTGGAGVSETTQCQTDTFHITNQVTVPVICGTNSGYHGE